MSPSVLGSTKRGMTLRSDGVRGRKTEIEVKGVTRSLSRVESLKMNTDKVGL